MRTEAHRELLLQHEGIIDITMIFDGCQVL